MDLWRHEQRKRQKAKDVVESCDVLSEGSGQVELLRRVVNLMNCPEQVDFMGQAVRPVEAEVRPNEGNNPHQGLVAGEVHDSKVLVNVAVRHERQNSAEALGGFVQQASTERGNCCLVRPVAAALQPRQSHLQRHGQEKKRQCLLEQGQPAELNRASFVALRRIFKPLVDRAGEERGGGERQLPQAVIACERNPGGRQKVERGEHRKVSAPGVEQREQQAGPQRQLRCLLPHRHHRRPQHHRATRATPPSSKA
mmetsp:Transcript_4827/g.20688  ORF Transcript_4827/g.20688 Transcript_4827/m.20688 type:complete len:253 (-) Transcript_4827:51-809(-)